YEEGDSMVYFDSLANGVITIFIISSTWLIVVMAAERYIAVCHPLRARKLISLRRTRTSIVLVFVTCALTTIPIFLEKRIEPCLADGRRVLVVRKRSEQSVTLRRILWSLFFDFIPCAALVYFNLCLIVQIRRAKRLREQMTPQRSSLLRWTAGSATSSSKAKRTDRTLNTQASVATAAELDTLKGQGGGSGGTNQRSVRGRRPSDSALNSVTATLVAVVILFLVLVSPSELLKFSISYIGASACQEQMVWYVTNFMQVLNFSLNFVLYCAVNKTFRHTLHGLVC
ncbi:hypothetical protein EGW08_021605, partial [Elysia chlorotica]